MICLCDWFAVGDGVEVGAAQVEEFDAPVVAVAGDDGRGVGDEALAAPLHPVGFGGGPGVDESALGALGEGEGRAVGDEGGVGG